MIIKNNLSSIHIIMNQDDAVNLLSMFKEMISKKVGFSFQLESEGKKSYFLLNCSFSDNEGDYIEIKPSSINLLLSDDSTDLAVYKIEQFLLDGFFTTPEWCECEAKDRMVSLYFIKK